MFRNLEARVPLSKRAERWAHLLADQRDAGPSFPLRDLYVGPGWTSSKALLSAFSSPAERQCDGFVISAGLGLQPLEGDGSTWPSYSATFAGDHPDSVAPGRSGHGHSAAEWWRTLAGTESLGGTTFEEIAQSYDAVVVVASGRYLTAVAQDLIAASRSDVQMVAFSASSARLGALEPYVVRLDPRARSVVAASDARASADFVAYVVGQLGDEIVDAEAARSFVRQALAGRTAPRRPRGISSSPEDVRSFIEESLREDPLARKGALLRRWRDQGRAFEQKKFGAIYDEVAEAARAERDVMREVPTHG